MGSEILGVRELQKLPSDLPVSNGTAFVRVEFPTILDWFRLNETWIACLKYIVLKGIFIHLLDLNFNKIRNMVEIRVIRKANF